MSMPKGKASSLDGERVKRSTDEWQHYASSTFQNPEIS